MHTKPLEKLEVERSDKVFAGSHVPAVVTETTKWSPQPGTLNEVIFGDHLKNLCQHDVAHAFSHHS